MLLLLSHSHCSVQRVCHVYKEWTWSSNHFSLVFFSLFKHYESTLYRCPCLVLHLVPGNVRMPSISGVGWSLSHIFSSKIWLRPQYRLHLVELVAILTCYVLWWKCRNLEEELTHSKCKWWTPPGLVMHFVLAFWPSLQRTYRSWRQEHMPLFFVVDAVLLH